MTTVPKENLDERIERIRRRNEEIEKKHREAEEDRIKALKENAMVLMTSPKEQDWPKGHKFDKLDFTYDIKPDKLENQSEELNSDKPASSARDFKKFAEGEGPPPDPVYNFLADAERDGRPGQKLDKKDTRLPKNEASVNSKHGGPHNNSFRNRNNEKNTTNPKFQKQNSQPEYETWRSERKRIDDARVSRQKVGDKWRREWDNDKINNSENNAMLKPTLGDAFNVSNQNGTKKSPTHTAKQHYNSYGNTGNDSLSEKRGNISVTVSSSGEVKSVKLTSAPSIGSGRVGPRQVTKPQFEVQSFELDKMSISQFANSPRARQSEKGQQKSNNQNNSNQQKSNPYIKKHQQLHQRNNDNNFSKNESSVKNTSITAWIPSKDKSENSITQQQNGNSKKQELTPRPEVAKKSVQDRLTRIRQMQPASEIVASKLKDTIDDSNEKKTNAVIDDIQAKNPITA